MVVASGPQYATTQVPQLRQARMALGVANGCQIFAQAKTVQLINNESAKVPNLAPELIL